MNNKKRILELTELVKAQNRRLEDFLQNRLEMKNNNHQKIPDLIAVAA